MKYKTIAAICCVLASFNCYAGLFGPSNYDDCILDGVKTAKTDAAVVAVHRACRNKFPDKSMAASPSTSNIQNGVCHLYWDGWKLVGGSKYKVTGYTTYSVEKDKVYRVDISFPDATIDSFRNSKEGIEASIGSFANSQASVIFRLCQ